MEYDEDDENDEDTIFAEEGKRCINPQEFNDYVSLKLYKQLPKIYIANFSCLAQ